MSINGKRKSLYFRSITANQVLNNEYAYVGRSQKYYMLEHIHKFLEYYPLSNNLTSTSAM